MSPPLTAASVGGSVSPVTLGDMVMIPESQLAGLVID